MWIFIDVCLMVVAEAASLLQVIPIPAWQRLMLQCVRKLTQLSHELESKYAFGMRTDNVESPDC